jgi:hypothetical protein
MSPPNPLALIMVRGILYFVRKSKNSWFLSLKPTILELTIFSRSFLDNPHSINNSK